jgi:DNA-binding MarR family transcriptional regulator
MHQEHYSTLSVAALSAERDFQDRVADFFQLKPAEILLPSKQRHRVKAKSLLCFWAVKGLGMSSLTIADRLGITQPSVSRLAQRGEKLAIENNLFLGE